jgi:hypothetical protein
VADIHLHVGLPKTGTTSIQVSLDAHASDLARRGVLVPGGGHDAHRLAAYDLLGQRMPGRGDVVAGAFDALVSELRGFTGPTAVVSEEELGRARPRHVRRMVRALAGHRVHVVVGVRDLGRTLTSAWQQAVLSGSTTTWSDYAAAVRDPDRGSVRAAASFRIRHDVLRVLDAWGTCVPPERICLVTVPPPGSPGTVLLERFAAAVGLPDSAWDPARAPRNVSLGAAEIELLRLLNGDLSKRLATGPYRAVVESALRTGWPMEGSRPLRLPYDELGWVRARSAATVAELAERGHRVHGDLADLEPWAADPAERRLDDVTDDELLDAARAGLVALGVAYGRLHRRYRRSFTERTGRPPTWRELVGSDGRAAWFATQRAALGAVERPGPLTTLGRSAVRAWVRATGRR